ncbi:CHAP domain-containing protein [Cribrihabitans neustonicus]|uniref:CHAP domain-containing protein n=1 Tax=Cribrihabitans neustonicus TaxID=1429085 RepID=UPI003B5BB230
MPESPARKPLRLLPLLAAGGIFLSACSPQPEGVSRRELDPERVAFAVSEAETLRARGHRVWCVPFARNASGISIYGNAKTWWQQAQEGFAKRQRPTVGAVMAFRATPSLPLGHVAVVSRVLEPRKILIDHANWHRNRVSLGMAVIDVSEDNDWSAVRVESHPGAFGRTYPVRGFISPAPQNS